jgi:hypothetical protein
MSREIGDKMTLDNVFALISGRALIKKEVALVSEKKLRGGIEMSKKGIAL